VAFVLLVFLQLLPRFASLTILFEITWILMLQKKTFMRRSLSIRHGL